MSQQVIKLTWWGNFQVVKLLMTSFIRHRDRDNIFAHKGN